MEDIAKLSRSHIISSIVLVCCLNVVVLVVSHLWNFEGVLIPMVVSTLFALVMDVTAALVWRWVATKHPKMLTSFFTAVSGFRFFIAMILMAVWYFISTRQEMMTFIMVFLLFYIASLLHHSIFFSRVSKRSITNKM